ncbi:MAG: superoxide dismutase family protein [Martelella sp.]|uniref:superoxide dismutase family protein n=1 Tax=Martelella sp. TaxID=1969699 RepID=UPI0032427130
MKRLICAAIPSLILPTVALSAEGDQVRGDFAGEGISGTVAMEETASGVVLVEVTAKGLPEGEHGFHVHQVGKCDPDTAFKSAESHLARGLDHGIETAGGPHPGDMPNLHAQSDGVAHAEFFLRGFTLGTTGNQRILDDDGSAVIIHSGSDDYSTQPSGGSGDRIACAVLEPSA